MKGMLNKYALGRKQVDLLKNLAALPEGMEFTTQDMIEKNLMEIPPGVGANEYTARAYCSDRARHLVYRGLLSRRAGMMGNGHSGYFYRLRVPNEVAQLIAESGGSPAVLDELGLTRAPAHRAKATPAAERAGKVEKAVRAEPVANKSSGIELMYRLPSGVVLTQADLDAVKTLLKE